MDGFSLGLSEKFQADTNHFLETISMHTQANFREISQHSTHENVGSDQRSMVTHDEKLTKLSQHHGLKDVGEVTLGHVLVENVDFLQKFAKSRAS
jgi:predicted DNA-binding protein YlxM (UPF0122 family)